MENKFVFVFIYLLSVLISSISQIMLKVAAQTKYPTKMQEYLNPLVLGAYVLFFGTTLLTMLALAVLPLSTGVVLESTGYIFVGILSFFILKEKVSARKMWGISLILLGIFVYAI